MDLHNAARLRDEIYGRPIDILARRTHFVDHIAPIWPHLKNRGGFYVPEVLLDYAKTKIPEAIGLSQEGRKDPLNVRPPGKNTLFTCAYNDMEMGMISDLKRPFIFMEHGVGLVFPGNPHYAGSVGLRRRVHLFLAPNVVVRDLTWTKFPKAPNEIVGTPKLDNIKWQNEINTANPTIAIAFHWDGKQVAKEAENAYPHYKEVLPDLAKQFHLIGHAHPRIQKYFEKVYNDLGVEFVTNFDEILARADIYINDASSTAFEFGTTGKPVILLNSPVYRRNINFGIRFWKYIDWAWSVDEPQDLIPTIHKVLKTPQLHVEQQQDMVKILYPHLGHSAHHAASVINGFLESREEGKDAIHYTRCSCRGLRT